jgi:hypothetical protein
MTGPLAECWWDDKGEFGSTVAPSEVAASQGSPGERPGSRRATPKVCCRACCLPPDSNGPKGNGDRSLDLPKLASQAHIAPVTSAQRAAGRPLTAITRVRLAYALPLRRPNAELLSLWVAASTTMATSTAMPNAGPSTLKVTTVAAAPAAAHRAN